MKSPFSNPLSPAMPLPRGVKTLLIANSIVFFLQWLPVAGPFLTDWGALVPYNAFVKLQVWRTVSYMFLHSTTSVFHFLFNMMGLWMFGRELEERWGTKRFLSFYGICGVGAGMFGILYLFSPAYSFVAVIGASGAVFGIMTAWALYNPSREIYLYFVVPVKAWVLVAGFAVLSLVFAFVGRDGVAHLVHLGGIVVAVVYLRGRPLFDGWRTGLRESVRERASRRRAEEANSRERFFAEKVDPILAKISREGMAALTPQEKNVLEEAGKYKERLKQGKIVPFEAFKK